MVLTETKQQRLKRDQAIRSEFAAMTGQKMPRYAYLAEKYNLSRISVQKILAGR